jgi:oxaloacetate decarboxylase gamma subunit
LLVDGAQNSRHDAPGQRDFTTSRGFRLNSQLLLQGTELLLLGMGIVFGFLALLVGLLHLMSRLAARLEPDASIPDAPQGGTVQSDDERIIAVISAAVARYRASHPS